ncbi:MAG: hypothetical protein V4812_06525 [Pseudomonadota bacterium]
MVVLLFFFKNAAAVLPAAQEFQEDCRKGYAKRLNEINFFYFINLKK